MGSVWSGGGTIVAWSSLIAVAGIVGVPVMELVRKNFVPVIAGLTVSTIIAVVFMMNKRLIIQKKPVFHF